MGGRRLVAISGTYGSDGTVYRTEIDGFSRTVSHESAGNGPAWFEVHTRTGQVLEFGHTGNSQVMAQGTATARAWAVNKIADTKGNYLTVHYLNNPTIGQVYPIEINYTGNHSVGLAPYNKVELVYATRPDTAPQYQAGSQLSTTVRLTNIKTYANGVMVADYRLAYELSSATQRSRLVSVTLCDATSSCMLATSFGWQDRIGGAFPVVYGASFGQFGHSNRSAGSYTGDFNGDGRADVLSWNDDLTYNRLHLSNRAGTFTHTQPAAFSPGFSQLGHSNRTMGILLGDFNGDGKTDVVRWYDDPTYTKVMLSNRDGAFPWRQCHRRRRASMMRSAIRRRWS
jgi:hypothetical protein